MRIVVPSLVALSLLVACGDPATSCPTPTDDMDASIEVPATAGLTVKPLRASFDVRMEYPTYLPIEIARTGGLVGEVIVSIDGAAAGVRSMDLVIPADASSGMLELHAVPDALTGEHVEVEITARGASDTTATAPVRLRVRQRAGSVADPFGIATTATMAHDSWGAAAVHADDELVVAGTRGGNTFVVARFMPDGSPDMTFDEDGELVRTFGMGPHQVNDIAIAADGTIYVAGFADGKSVILSVLASGAPNTAFDEDGVRFIDSVTDLWTITVLDDGRLRAGANVGGAVHVFGLTASGAPDQSFHGGTPFVYDTADGDYVEEIVLRADGSLLVAGATAAASGDQGLVIALDASGEPLGSFGGGDGVTTVRPNDNAFWANDVLALADGRVLVGGTSGVAALDAAGVETFFGLDGYLVVDGHDVKDMLVVDGRLHMLVQRSGVDTITVAFLDGLIDRSFGVNGSAELTPTSGTTNLAELVATADALVAVGNVAIGGGFDAWMMGIAR